ncbi:MAG TPA: TonB family protein, partial [Anaeromyxobacteraceae bacterium]|nr:TonB family protein [Anaeromyxobacteraceae bacterium]
MRPPELLEESLATYPESLKPEALGGEVELEIEVGESGTVVGSTIVRHAHPLFDAAALEAAAGLRFRPATLAGKPVPVRLRFTYRFIAPAHEEPAPQGAAPPRPVGLVAGQVRSRGNRNPIPGATLASADGAVTQTDPQGRFQLRIPADGAVAVEVRAPGFRTRSFEERIKPDEKAEVVYSLDPERVNPYETVIHGERRRTEVSRVSLQAQELKEVPGTMGDPFRVIMLMPGVGSMLSGVAYPVVRGAAPASTGYYLDGVRVPVLFHLFLGPAVIHPDFIDGIDFIPGAPPPRYGRLLGGVIEGKTTR